MEKNSTTGELLNYKPKVELIAESGLGFGTGTISYAEEQNPNTLRAAKSVIQSREILVPIDRDDNNEVLDDDGCGDGRGVGSVFRKVDQSIIEFKKSLNRAKVFGGGPAMAVGAEIGLGRTNSMDLIDVFNDAISSLQSCGIDFGGHEDEHASGGKCGCGAIDNAPAIVKNVNVFSEDILAVVSQLGGNTDLTTNVIRSYKTYANEMQDDASYTGRAVMDKIYDAGKVVKKLAGGHKERFIVLNTVEGYTVNQKTVRQTTQGDVDVFAVDIWRVRALANRLFAEESDDAKERAYISMLVYTLSTAGTLTAGDLPVYMVSEQESTAPIAA